MMEWRNPVFNHYGGIDCEINHPSFGWIPFTAASGDSGGSFDVDAMIAEMTPSAAPAPDLPPPPIPQVVSRFQARAALMLSGHLAAVEAAVAQADPIVQLAWAEAVEWKRSSPTIIDLGDAIGLTPEQIDELFIQAAEIEA